MSVKGIFVINATLQQRKKDIYQPSPASQKAYQRNSETTSVNTVRAKGFVCRAAKEYQEIPKEITTSKLFPRWAFKDYCRSEIGGWDMKPETEGVLEYIRELKAAENMYY